MINICKQDTDKVLLVEGKDDCHVVMNLCQAHDVPENFGIYECGGVDKNKIFKRLNALIIRPNPPKIIGVMVDADESSSSRWQSIQDKLRNNNHEYAMPKTPDPDGTIIEAIEDKPKLGFWLMPNNQDSGMLEDFCAELADQNSLIFAEECVEEANKRHVTKFTPKDRSKAIIHTYLAWQDKPGNPLGQAITNQSLRPNTPIALTFTNWLRRLFTD